MLKVVNFSWQNLDLEHNFFQIRCKSNQTMMNLLFHGIWKNNCCVCCTIFHISISQKYKNVVHACLYSIRFLSCRFHMIYGTVGTLFSGFLCNNNQNYSTLEIRNLKTFHT